MGYTKFGKFELSGNPQSILVAIPPTGPILECSWILRKHQSPLRSYLLSYFRTAEKEMQFFPCSKSFQIENFFSIHLWTEVEQKWDRTITIYPPKKTQTHSLTMYWAHLFPDVDKIWQELPIWNSFKFQAKFYFLFQILVFQQHRMG